MAEWVRAFEDMISFDQLVRIMPYAKQRADRFIDPLNAAMNEFDISENGLREAAFLAQIAHESGELRYVEEIYSGENYDIGTLAIKLGNTPEDDDDGEFHKGYGLIQLTGKSNQFACADHFGIPRERIQEWLKSHEGACRSAAWFWQSRGLNELADKQDFLRITKKINGGTNGWNERQKYYQRALEVIGE